VRKDADTTWVTIGPAREANAKLHQIGCLPNFRETLLHQFLDAKWLCAPEIVVMMEVSPVNEGEGRSIDDTTILVAHRSLVTDGFSTLAHHQACSFISL
jgi:hypothetical protein